MGRKRIKMLSKESYRNLTQYRDLSDEEFEKVYEEIVAGETTTREFEDRINRKIEDFSKDYDISDLKINDMLTLRALAQAFITLEDLERYYFKLRQSGLDDTDIIRLEKLNNVLSMLRRDISNLQNDLKITRKIRKGDQEESVINFIENIKQKARKFYFSRMRPVVCPNCGTWIASVWSLYPDDAQSKIRLHCRRRFPDGKICNTTLDISIKELYNTKNEILPETID
jgi:polyhydroxyalkanoate synthesis regulator phasin